MLGYGRLMGAINELGESAIRLQCTAVSDLEDVDAPATVAECVKYKSAKQSNNNNQKPRAGKPSKNGLSLTGG